MTSTPLSITFVFFQDVILYHYSEDPEQYEKELMLFENLRKVCLKYNLNKGSYEPTHDHKTSSEPSISYTFCISPPPHPVYPTPSFPPSNAIPMGEADDHYLSHLERGCMCKPYALVRITKKSFL